ncbi:uncharacterized protein EDB93DRAFT_1085371 [Suillus bovinus]|uniref:uncharacterized protein n=1 Tax=Suillus bovinus TaxID=48563 RepID=UPI001B869E80|nr:uncharacterized protein EDB93DRAFT_1085371 [Suillus bovinus]KAG2147780.1 hypothetical protein EDB93DRAFT_1085371 [Suillus bovinus]
MRSVTQFKQGGMVIELTTKEAATLIHSNTDIKNELTRNLNPEATFRERTYSLIVLFMPVSYDPSNKDNIKQLEKENEWNEGAISMAHWVKPVEKQSSTQRVAHLMLTFTDPQTANSVICKGIMVDHMLLWLKKNR